MRRPERPPRAMAIPDREAQGPRAAAVMTGPLRFGRRPVAREPADGAPPMIGSRRVWRTRVTVALAILGTAIADGRGIAQDQAASLSGSFRRAVSRARGALVSVRVPDGSRSGLPYMPTRPGRFGPAPFMPPMPDRPADAESRLTC